MVAGMTGSNCENPVKESDLNKAISCLYQNIEALEGRVKLLITRLNGILYSTPKCAEERKEDNELRQCGLAKSIRGAANHIDKIQSMINDTIEDLQI